jgi:hypothetical protein
VPKPSFPIRITEPPSASTSYSPFVAMNTRHAPSRDSPMYGSSALRNVSGTDHSRCCVRHPNVPRCHVCRHPWRCRRSESLVSQIRHPWPICRQRVIVPRWNTARAAPMLTQISTIAVDSVRTGPIVGADLQLQEQSSLAARGPFHSDDQLTFRNVRPEHPRRIPAARHQWVL